MPRRFALLGLFFLGSVAGVKSAGAQVVDSSVTIAMRDGVVLRATLLRPSIGGRFPTLVYRTPYGAAAAVRGDSIFSRAVGRGYAVVVQDVRGRYRSDGRFDPYRQEGRDGYDTTGERVFGAAAGLDYDELVLRFMDRYVRGLDNGVDREPPVKVFVMGENRWRTADRWPLPDITPLRLSLGRMTDGRGTLGDAPPAAAIWTIVTDPATPVVDPFEAAYGAHDYRALAAHPGVMVFDSEPFARDTRVVGPIEVRLTVSIDVPDADVYVRLFDVEPADTAWNLMSPGLEVTRLSARAGTGARAVPLRPNEPVEVTVGHHLTGNLFRAGHRLRAVVMPSFFPHFSVNPQSGQRETETSARRAGNLTVHYGPDRGSYLLLPVVR